MTDNAECGATRRFLERRVVARATDAALEGVARDTVEHDSPRRIQHDRGAVTGSWQTTRRRLEFARVQVVLGASAA